MVMRNSPTFLLFLNSLSVSYLCVKAFLLKITAKSCSTFQNGISLIYFLCFPYKIIYIGRIKGEHIIMTWYYIPGADGFSQYCRFPGIQVAGYFSFRII